VSYYAYDFWWWPYLFILLAGWLMTDGFRFLGVYFGGRIAEDSEALVVVRTLATALVAAVIGNLVVFPSGGFASPRWSSASPSIWRCAKACCSASSPARPC
jgi:hypothetical protein